MTLEERIKEIKEITQFSKNQRDYEASLYFIEGANEEALSIIKELQEERDNLKAENEKLKETLHARELVELHEQDHYCDY